MSRERSYECPACHEEREKCRCAANGLALAFAADAQRDAFEKIMRRVAGCVGCTSYVSNAEKMGRQLGSGCYSCGTFLRRCFLMRVDALRAEVERLRSALEAYRRFADLADAAIWGDGGKADDRRPTWQAVLDALVAARTFDDCAGKE